MVTSLSLRLEEGTGTSQRSEGKYMLYRFSQAGLRIYVLSLPDLTILI